MGHGDDSCPTAGFVPPRPRNRAPRRGLAQAVRRSAAHSIACCAAALGSLAASFGRKLSHFAHRLDCFLGEHPLGMRNASPDGSHRRLKAVKLTVEHRQVKQHQVVLAGNLLIVEVEAWRLAQCTWVFRDHLGQGRLEDLQDLAVLARTADQYVKHDES